MFKCVIGGFCHFSTLNFPHRLNLDYLRKLQTVLGSNFTINEDITYVESVRLIDRNNKFIGVLSMEEAKRKAKATNLDLILINTEVQPAVCRLMDYSEELGKKFMKEILVTDQDKREKMVQKQTKLLKLGSKISIQDLKVKSNMAQDQLKKAKQVRVQIICEKDYVPQSQNILMTFRDLCTAFMTPMSEIRVKDLEPKDDIFSKDTKEPKKVVEWTFRSLDVQFEKQEEYTLEDIKKQIDLHYNRLKSKKIIISMEDIKQAQAEDYKEEDDEDLQMELMQFVNKKQVTKTKRKKGMTQGGLDGGIMELLGIGPEDVENQFKELNQMKLEHGDEVMVDMIKNNQDLDDRNTLRLIKILKAASQQKL